MHPLEKGFLSHGLGRGEKGAWASQLGEACPGPLQGPGEVRLRHWQVLSGMASGRHASGRGQTADIPQGTEQSWYLQSGPRLGSPSSGCSLKSSSQSGGEASLL